ncbi:hypothetical protein CYMTET_27202 [Cymbomonas tetramitiformis]|uniref:Phytanoyl-CoA dioxygenase n=1 Tax=Cymbomonas tetramitiformis TaxID=36881 RepID=A0AAE0KX46_9CHLO|nr:hypothetical protein CYMTET_27202 [Cymbomonas tetramitiformis]
MMWGGLQVVEAVWRRIAPGLLEYMDAADSLPLMAPRPMLILNGETDGRCWIEGLEEPLRNATQAYKLCGVEDRIKLQGESAARKTASTREAFCAKQGFREVLMDRLAAKDEQTQGQFYRSEQQLLVSWPGSETQQVHIDNLEGHGLTLIVPLVDVRADMGPTQLLPGTYHIHKSGGLLRALAEWWNVGAIAPTLTAGDALIYDARMWHQGLGNQSEVSRPVLVFRYDEVAHIPPGQGFGTSSAIMYGGSFLLFLRHLIVTDLPPQKL